MRERVQSIQFLRFVAASLVVFSHSMLAIDTYSNGNESRSILYLTNFGAVGVHIFFVISGFIMVYTSFRKDGHYFNSPKFLLRRFIRIYPIYWIYAAGYLLFHEVGSTGYNLSVGEIFKSLLLLPGYSSLIIGPGWTLAYEVYFYICFAIFMNLGLLRGLLAMTIFFLISITVGVVFHFDDAIAQVVTNSLLMEFLAGAWVAYLFVSEARLSITWSNGLLLLAAIVFIGSFAYGYHRMPSILTWGVPSALLVAGFVFKERSGGLGGLVRTSSFLGDSSYSLYLLHILLIDIFFGAFLAVFPQTKFGYIAICLGFTAFCVAIAYLSYEIVERRVVTSLQAIVRSFSKAAVSRRIS
jgi:exopolysaccharide production protein ExoZ